MWLEKKPGFESREDEVWSTQHVSSSLVGEWKGICVVRRYSYHLVRHQFVSFWDHYHYYDTAVHTSHLWAPTLLWNSFMCNWQSWLARGQNHTVLSQDSKELVTVSPSEQISWNQVKMRGTVATLAYVEKMFIFLIRLQEWLFPPQSYKTLWSNVF